MIHEQCSTLYLVTPRGKARVLYLINRGPDAHLEWVCVLPSGEIWSFLNPEVLVSDNVTMGIHG